MLWLGLSLRKSITHIVIVLKQITSPLSLQQCVKISYESYFSDLRGIVAFNLMQIQTMECAASWKGWALLLMLYPI